MALPFSTEPGAAGLCSRSQQGRANEVQAVNLASLTQLTPAQLVGCLDQVQLIPGLSTLDQLAGPCALCSDTAAEAELTVIPLLQARRYAASVILQPRGILHVSRNAWICRKPRFPSEIGIFRQSLVQLPALHMDLLTETAIETAENPARPGPQDLTGFYLSFWLARSPARRRARERCSDTRATGSQRCDQFRYSFSTIARPRCKKSCAVTTTSDVRGQNRV